MKYNTPVYITSRDKIVQNYKEISENLSFAHVYYALKPNSEMPILEVLNSVKCDFEIASEGDFDRLNRIGVSANRIICSLPVKKSSTIEYLYMKGCRYFVFDDKRELEKLITIALEAKKILRIYISDITSNNIDYGMKMNEFERSFTGTNLIDEIDGITFYILNNIDIDVLENVLNRCEVFFEKLGGKDKILNIGGNYDLKENLPLGFYNRLEKKIEFLIKKFGINVFAEPGRSIVKTAVKLLTEVVLIKERGNYKQVFIDASSQIVKLKPDKVSLVNRKDFASQSYLYMFYENLCSHYKLFEMELNFKIEENDIIALEDYGCYSICFANGFHGAYPPEQTMV